MLLGTTCIYVYLLLWGESRVWGFGSGRFDWQDLGSNDCVAYSLIGTYSGRVYLNCCFFACSLVEALCPSQQLRSCQDGQFTYITTLFPGKLD